MLHLGQYGKSGSVGSPSALEARREGPEGFVLMVWLLVGGRRVPVGLFVLVAFGLLPVERDTM